MHKPLAKAPTVSELILQRSSSNLFIDIFIVLITVYNLKHFYFMDFTYFNVFIEFNYSRLQLYNESVKKGPKRVGFEPTLRY